MDGARERREIRRGRRRFRLLLVGTVVVFALVSLLVGLLAGGFRARWLERGDPPGWVENTGVVLAVSGLVAEVAAVVWMVRSGGYRADRESRLWTLSWGRRRALAQAVRRGVVGSPDDLPWLRTTAAQMVRQRRYVLLLGGLTTMNLGQALLSFAPAWLVVLGITVMMFGLSCWQLLRDARRAEAFLRTHPADPAVTTPTGSR
ncbi:hypothetical protein GCE86_23595 [Micromonospora terminaliae]|uniref:Uncharacterized protein n=1 Tax=Micromonospora terminaliae TaxID=1914461 RepID=A0AAJ2ZKH8_9ACTN|nr:hypothetical protein [Micromonospora terminaliae]NES31436.1 hypothetical protein [Micromonospora terminaliae]QGL49749.1 hypothetical protein GCE86_23595 [Micromonospora terminaliae]